MKNLPEKAFLGEEFLTWLWYRTETGQGEFLRKNGSYAGASMEDFLLFGGDDRDELEQTLRRGLPSKSPEATTALAEGKRLARARLTLATGEREWVLVLDGRTFDFLSVKCPEEDPEDIGDDPMAKDLARMQGFAELSDLVDELFGLFLETRLSPSFEDKEVPRIRAWIRDRQKL
ncbi:MAG TPA: hypothetical protein ENK02_01670 [Planctomycetes bacterium]|nr:hypothetical protein [Planctomycetota bacterium]